MVSNYCKYLARHISLQELSWEQNWSIFIKIVILCIYDIYSIINYSDPSVLRPPMVNHRNVVFCYRSHNKASEAYEVTLSNQNIWSYNQGCLKMMGCKMQETLNSKNYQSFYHGPLIIIHKWMCITYVRTLSIPGLSRAGPPSKLLAEQHGLTGTLWNFYSSSPVTWATR